MGAREQGRLIERLQYEVENHLREVYRFGTEIRMGGVGDPVVSNTVPSS